MTITKKLSTYDFFVSSITGNVRENNEDAFYHEDTVNGFLFVVCDGMGGIPGGEIASKIATVSVFKFINNEWKNNPYKLLKDACIFANSEIIKYAFEKKLNETPGTTIVVGLIRDNKFYYAHAGDSRIYFITGKKIFRLTDDHSFVFEQIKKGNISETDSFSHPEKNKITNALGVFNIFKPEVCKEPIIPKDGSHILFCTDGLSSFVKDKKIIEITSQKITIEEKIDLLINKAIENESDDNITTLLINFFNPGNLSENIISKTPEISKKRLKLIALVSISVFILIVIFISKFLINTDNTNINNLFNMKTPAKGIIHIRNSKTKQINIYKSNSIKKNEIISLFNLRENNYTKKNINSEYSQYNIHIQDILIIKPGENIHIIAKFYNLNFQKIIMTNNKKELLILPCEKLIIPLSLK